MSSNVLLCMNKSLKNGDKKTLAEVQEQGHTSVTSFPVTRLHTSPSFSPVALVSRAPPPSPSALSFLPPAQELLLIPYEGFSTPWPSSIQHRSHVPLVPCFIVTVNNLKYLTEDVVLARELSGVSHLNPPNWEDVTREYLVLLLELDDYSTVWIISVID